MPTNPLTQYRVWVELDCPDHHTLHSVTGFTEQKQEWQNLKKDLLSIYKDDYPDCHIKPEVTLKQLTFKAGVTT